MSPTFAPRSAQRLALGLVTALRTEQSEAAVDLIRDASTEDKAWALLHLALIVGAAMPGETGDVALASWGQEVAE